MQPTHTHKRRTTTRLGSCAQMLDLNRPDVKPPHFQSRSSHPLKIPRCWLKKYRILTAWNPVHHYYNCVTVISGEWQLIDCRFENSHTRKPTARASLAIEVRAGKCSVSKSVIETCTRGVTVAAGAELVLKDSVLEGNREAVSGDGDARVVVQDCEFIDNTIAFQFSDDVSGEVCHNVLSHSNIWSHGHPPTKVLWYENQVTAEGFHSIG